MNLQRTLEIAEQYGKGLAEAELRKDNPDEKPPKLIQPETQPSDFTTADDYWEIQGVKYRNGIYTVKFSKELLPSKTQEQHAEHRNQAITKQEFYTADAPLYHSLFSTMFEQKTSDKAQEIEQARQFIQNSMRKNYPMTLTRVAYQPKVRFKTAKDKVIHNYGTSDSYEIDEQIRGPDRQITSQDSSALNALLGDSDVDKISQIYNWINQTPTWIWRVNAKPKNTDERVVRFYANSGWADLDCYWDPSDSDSSLGVLLCAEGARS